MVEAITRLGGEALICPMIAVQPLAMAEAHLPALRKLDEFTWLIFTSASAVEMFILWLDQAQVQELPPTLRLAAIGKKTAAAVRARAAAAMPPPTTTRPSRQRSTPKVGTGINAEYGFQMACCFSS